MKSDTRPTQVASLLVESGTSVCPLEEGPVVESKNGECVVSKDSEYVVLKDEKCVCGFGHTIMTESRGHRFCSKFASTARHYWRESF